MGASGGIRGPALAAAFAPGVAAQRAGVMVRSTIVLRGLRARRARFWGGAVLVGAGVLLHVPAYVAARGQHFMMAGMPMGMPMSIGMTLVATGLAVGAWGLLPDRATRRRALHNAGRNAIPVTALDDVKLCRAHWSLVAVLTIGLVVDTMKPASLGFVVPPMAAEYGLGLKTAALLPFFAIAGTVVGSLTWGRLADVYGRRATILLSSLMYIATSICGFMPSFTWNLVMCFLMGAAAGGMLPTVYALVSESIPARHRGWILVVMSGAGATLGYLAASGAATAIEPVLSWRALWLLNAPTGLLLLALSRYIPESARFLMMANRRAEAHEVMARFGIVVHEQPAITTPVAENAMVRRQGRGGFRNLFSASYYRRSLAVILYGIGWSLVNWGFITFLPAYLSRAGVGVASTRLLFFASLISLPAIGLAGVLYVYCRGKRAMLAYAAGVTLVLAAFAVADPAQHGTSSAFVPLTAILLTGSSGMVAMLSPYAAELYPTSLRASGSGMAAAATKVGGIFGPLLLTSAPSIPALALWTLLPLTVAIAVLWRLGPALTAGALTEIAIVPEKVGQT
jgi:MFS transporter, putative metabolite:H+ symporter